MDEGNFAAFDFVRTEDEDVLVLNKPFEVTGFAVIGGDCYVNGAATVTGDIIVGGEIATGGKSVFYFTVYIATTGGVLTDGGHVIMPFGGYLHALYGIVWDDVGASGGIIRLVHDGMIADDVDSTPKADFDLTIPDATVAGTVLTSVVIDDDTYVHFVEGDALRLQVNDATTNAAALTVVLEVYRTQR